MGSDLKIFFKKISTFLMLKTCQFQLKVVLEITSSANTSLISISFIRPKVQDKSQKSPNKFSFYSPLQMISYRKM